MAAAGGVAESNDLRHDARDFSRRVELAFAFTRVLGKVPHQVFVSIAQQVVAVSSVGSKIKFWFVEDFDELGKTIHHGFAFAKFVVVVEVGDINDSTQVVGGSKFANDDIHLFADVLFAGEGNHV